MSDATADGRRIKICNHSTTTHAEQFAEQRGYPASITCDNGPDFISDALDQWAVGWGVKTKSGTVNFRRTHDDRFSSTSTVSSPSTARAADPVAEKCYGCRASKV